MEGEFFNLYERQSNLAVEVGHNSIADWCITVYDARGTKLKDGERVISVQEYDRSLAFEKAYVELTEYLSDKRGGY